MGRVIYHIKALSAVFRTTLKNLNTTFFRTTLKNCREKKQFEPVRNFTKAYLCCLSRENLVIFKES